MAKVYSFTQLATYFVTIDGENIPDEDKKRMVEMFRNSPSVGIKPAVSVPNSKVSEFEIDDNIALHLQKVDGKYWKEVLDHVDKSTNRREGGIDE